jgi:hypothetical protein
VKRVIGATVARAQGETLPGKLPFTALYSLSNEDLAGSGREMNMLLGLLKLDELCLHEVSVITTTRCTMDIT